MTQATVDYAVERLTQTWTDVIAPAEPGEEYKHVEHGPLLDLLEESVRSSLGRTTAGPGSGSDRSPIDLRAFTMLENIDSIVRAWGREFNLDHKADLKTLLSAVYVELEALWVTNQVVESVYVGLTNGFVRWADEIWNMFDPPIRKEITAPCPECGERYFYTADEERQASLIATARPTHDPHVDCQRCGAHWEGKESMMKLAFTIGANSDHDELGTKESIAE
ncbi:hypothetical protein IT072_02490 [Leifsonia sp. ZF2019]|uniref:DUF7341 domain-containing protein n=1 Tax=Leifsonia sp. ZF2019 TaxID=2781978 RepID=UPI001CBF2439|nr:hypothetical protein [Leifsonia sp. ZF2019]UAJ79966.1 hypothetical protein IT072_02490 [Leifsonia sp. ZF2019]